jgi:uncharacterized membrane protein
MIKTIRQAFFIILVILTVSGIAARCFVASVAFAETGEYLLSGGLILLAILIMSVFAGVLMYAIEITDGEGWR